MSNLKVSDIPIKKEYLVEKYTRKKDLPRSIRLEACSICQLNCKVCYMRLNPEAVKNGCGSGMLSFENFKKLVDTNNFERIELSNQGEIFLNPELPQIIKYAYEKNIKLTAATGVNFNYLSDEQAEAMVKYDFDTFTVSLDGASQETYVQYRQNGDFDKVINNVKKINYYKKKYNKKSPYIVWKFIIFGHNEHEIKKAKHDAKKLGFDELIFDVSYENEFSPLRNPNMVRKETGINHLDINASPAIQLAEFKKGVVDWYYCNFLWEAPQINWDGQILGCCENYKDNFGTTDFTENIKDILNNPKIIYAKNMLTGKAPALEGIPCSSCYVYKAMQKENIWLDSPRNIKNI